MSWSSEAKTRSNIYLNRKSKEIEKEKIKQNACNDKQITEQLLIGII